MKIAIDAHSVGTQLAGNVSYITNLIEALAEIDNSNNYSIYVTKAAAVERFRGRWANFEVRQVYPHTPLIRIPLSLAIELRRRPVDVLHVQFTAPPFANCKVVSTIPDISYEHLPETFNRRSRFQMRATIRHTAKRAAHVITVSEYSRLDIIDKYGLPPEKITTIPLAASDLFRPVTGTTEIDRVRQKYGLPSEFILSVGSIQPRKNLTRLIEAYSMLVGKRSDVPHLVLVGKKAWLYDEIIRSPQNFAVADRVIFTGFVPNDDLPAIYTAAQIFVYPSFFEGFGLPPLEAMKCGTPVITGNLTSLPEVVGDAALTVDPYDTGAIAAALEQLITNKKLRSKMRARGFEQAKKFSWTETARQTLMVYERVMGDPAA